MGLVLKVQCVGMELHIFSLNGEQAENLLSDIKTRRLFAFAFSALDIEIYYGVRIASLVLHMKVSKLRATSQAITILRQTQH